MLTIRTIPSTNHGKGRVVEPKKSHGTTSVQLILDLELPNFAVKVLKTLRKSSLDLFNYIINFLKYIYTNLIRRYSLIALKKFLILPVSILFIKFSIVRFISVDDKICLCNEIVSRQSIIDEWVETMKYLLNVKLLLAVKFAITRYKEAKNVKCNNEVK